ncbi:MAG: MCE family protein [Oscillatoria sp. SIO1A7]|nr:MCE family protein [Oscillatoria sp. SIO1A7]
MRSRKLREGSVGLLMLFGVGLFIFLASWLRGLNFGSKNYTIVAEFENIAKLQDSAPVRYRGVTVGKVIAVKPGSNGVDVEMLIVAQDLIIPRDVYVEVNQSGFIGETSIDIIPLKPLSAVANATSPVDTDCNSDLIVCDRDRLKGQLGVTFDELLRSTLRFSKTFADPAFVGQLNTLIKNSTAATAEIAELSRELNVLTQLVQRDLGPITTKALDSANTLAAAATRISVTASQFGPTAQRINTAIDEFGTTANQLRGTASQINELIANANATSSQVNELIANANATSSEISGLIANASATSSEISGLIANANATSSEISGLIADASATSSEINSLVANVNSLVTANRSTLVGTLDNLNQTSQELRTAVGGLSPAIARIQGQVNDAGLIELLSNLEVASENIAQLSVDATEASANLRDLSNPTNLLLLQQTLDSARLTFENVEKITSDLDRLTGDPNFLNNIRELIDTLNNLLSSSEDLERQAELAENLAILNSAVNASVRADLPESDPRSQEF